MTKTKISWADRVWNAVTGCTKVSAGCANCYAETHAHRFWGDRAFTNVRFHADRLDKPDHWREPSAIFVNSMSDLFHPDVADGQIIRILDTVYRNPRHAFLVLTKRPERMRSFMAQWADLEGEPDEPQLVRGPTATKERHPSGRGHLFADMLDSLGKPPKGSAYPTFDWMEGPRWWPACPGNLWLGVSVEDQTTADERIPVLLDTPCARRFVSVEPLLERIDRLPGLDGRPGLDWIIVGGESGPNARACDAGWITRIADQGRGAGVPVFVKQLGDRPTGFVKGDGSNTTALGRKGENLEAFPTTLRIRDVPQGIPLSRS